MTQSNSLLLCAVKAEGEEKGGVGGGGSSSKCVAQVCSNVAEIWELSPVVARIGRIAHLLQDSMYHGKEEEEEEEYKKSQDWTNKKLYTPQQISSIVQASPRELQQGLDQNRVLLLDGYYRMIAPSFLLEALQILMNRLDRCGHSYDSVPIEETLSSLQEDHDIRKEVIQAILLQWFGKKKQGDNDEIVELNGQDIVKFIGIQLLESKAKSNQIELQSFLNEWEKTTGPLLSHHIDLPLLKVSWVVKQSNRNSKLKSLPFFSLSSPSLSLFFQGHYLTFPVPPTQPSDSIPAMVQHFDASDLPLDPSTRLQYLFLKRSQWTLQELTPFLDEIAIDAKKRDAILLKYARSTKVKVPLPETKLERRDRLKKGNVEGPIELLQLYSARLRHA